MKTNHLMAVLGMAMLNMMESGFAADAQTDANETASNSAVGLASAGQNDPWRLGVSVPLWAAGLDGTVKAGGREADLHVPFDKIAEHLDAAFALGLEARKEDYGFYADATYMKLSAGGSGPGGNIHGNLDLKFLLADVGGFYRLVKIGNDCPFVLDATAGLRYWGIKSDLTITDLAGTTLLDRSGRKWLLDPVAGLRASQYFTAKLHLDVQGDVGGFDILHKSADFDWSAVGQLTYDFTQMFSLSAGYKAVGVDVSPSVRSRDIDLNLIFHGVLIAAKFTF